MVPRHWTDVDRKLYISIGKRKKSEHVLAYAAVSIGAQLFHHITTLENDKQKRAVEELESADSDADDADADDADADDADDADAADAEVDAGRHVQQRAELDFGGDSADADGLAQIARGAGQAR